MWKDRYKFGVKIIDEQHKELFSRVSDFLFTLRGNDWDDIIPTVKEVLKFMQRYIVVHTEAEELYQMEINYPGLKMHQEMHDMIRNELTVIADQFRVEGYNKALVQKFASQLLALLLKHVGVCDREIVYFARECPELNPRGPLDSNNAAN